MWNMADTGYRGLNQLVVVMLGGDDFLVLSAEMAQAEIGAMTGHGPLETLSKFGRIFKFDAKLTQHLIQTLL